MENKVTRNGLSANALKLIAIAAMLIDHIGWAFVPKASLLGQVMHGIGRLTAPIMCFFVAEGYFHTRDMKKYIGRMMLFAVISHFAFVFYETGELSVLYSTGNMEVSATFYTSVIYTLLLGLIALIVWKKEQWSMALRVAIIISLCVLAVMGDWYFISVLWILFFGIYRDNAKKKFLAFSIVGIVITVVPLIFPFSEKWWDVLFQFGIYLSIPLLMQYNGTLGRTKKLKWIFYIFYPLHLFILGFIKFYS